ncbi:MAG: response regulator [Steroidobacteraceae bacterium]
MIRILVIDDEPDVRDSLRLVLQQAGYAVSTAADAPSGLEQYRRDPADVVITDIIMPRGHGVDLIRDLRAAFPQVRIIAVSGGGNFGAHAYSPEAITTTAYLAAAREAGADLVLTKPFDRETLLAALSRVHG